jgi:hypothetical protein
MKNETKKKKTKDPKPYMQPPGRQTTKHGNALHKTWLEKRAAGKRFWGN